MLNEARRQQANNDSALELRRQQEEAQKIQDEARLKQLVEESNNRLKSDPRYIALAALLENPDLNAALEAIWDTWKFEEDLEVTRRGFWGNTIKETKKQKPKLNPYIQYPEVTTEMFVDPDNQYGPRLLTMEQSSKAIDKALSNGISLVFQGGSHPETHSETSGDDTINVTSQYPNRFGLSFRYDEKGEIRIFDFVKETLWGRMRRSSDQGLSLNETLQKISIGVAEARSGQAFVKGLLGY